MGKAFSEQEKSVIYNKLIDIGVIEIGKYGFRKVSIEEITKKAAISKGAFYKFFPSKEIFFFKIMEKIESNLKVRMNEVIPPFNENFREQFIENIINYLNLLRAEGIIELFSCGDMDFITRGVPEEEISKHLMKDNLDIKDLLEPLGEWLYLEKINYEFISAMTRALFLIVVHEEQIGAPSSYDMVIKAQISIIVDYILEFKM